MSKIFLAIIFLVSAPILKAQQLAFSDADSKVAFVIKNMGMDVNGTLKGLKGTIQFDPKNFTSGTFDVTVDVGTINTGNTKRDNHLKAEDYFDAGKYPVMRIKSAQIVAKDGNNYKAVVMLTIKNITKKIGLDFTAIPSASGYRFSSIFKIDRRAFGVGGNSMILGDEVKVNISVLATR